MKKSFLFLILFSLVLFSCKKEKIYTNNSELWLKVDSSIESLDISFNRIDTKGKSLTFSVNYNNGIFTPVIKEVKELRDGKNWNLVYSGLDKSNEIIVSYNGKEYKTRGFYLGERRCLEISLVLSGDIDITDYDISMIDQEIYVE